MLLVESCVIVRLPNVSGASDANPDMGALVQAVLRNIRNLHLEPMQLRAAQSLFTVTAAALCQ